MHACDSTRLDSTASASGYRHAIRRAFPDGKMREKCTFGGEDAVGRRSCTLFWYTRLTNGVHNQTQRPTRFLLARISAKSNAHSHR